jgi:hypothetical protein
MDYLPGSPEALRSQFEHERARQQLPQPAVIPAQAGTHFDLALFSILHEEQHGFPLARE